MNENTPITKEQLSVLMANLNSHRISTRSQGGRSLSYLEAWDVKATLIRVFGFAGFSAEIIDTQIIEIKREDAVDRQGKAYEKIVSCVMSTCRLTIHQTGAVYTESATASQTGRDIGEVTDFAMKTASSDALKRAAIYLGTQFGLSLYNNGSTQEVVRVCFAPDQFIGPPEPVEPTPEQAETLAKSLGQKQLQGDEDK